MIASTVRCLGLIALLGALGACAVTGQPGHDRPSGAQAPLPSGAVSYGVVTAIDRVNASSRPFGTGALIGGAVGAMVGRELGEKAMGRATATMVGAAAGAMIGHEIEHQKSGGAPDRVRVSVLFDEGSTRVIELATAGELRVGDHVRVENNRIQRL